MTTAADLATEGMTTATNAADPRTVLMIDDLIAEANATGQPWSANDIRERVPVVSRGLVGSRVKAASQRKPSCMHWVGAEPSDLPSTHGKDIAIWCGLYFRRSSS